MPSVFGRILLVTGGSEFLADRTRRRAVAAVLAEDPECEISEAVGGQLVPGELLTLTSPSLFSASSAVVVHDLQDLADDVQAELLAYAAEPAAEVALVLVHGGGQKGRGLLDKLRKTTTVSEAKQEAPKYERDHAAWVRQEVRQLGAAMSEQAASTLVTAIGLDLRALAGAADQLVASVPQGEEVSVEIVRRYFGGRAEVRGYEIADAVFDGRLDIAVERLRWAFAARTSPVVIVSAVASGLRQLVRLATAPQGLRDAELAKHVGAPPFKIQGMRRQLNQWDPAGLQGALAAVAQADLDVKGATADAEYATERMVLRVASLRLRPSRG
ncbi:MAG: DNA polymerase III subunit delta [Aeromicrobium sp.]|uniref:DNA polymerase III subunit delta n=1 Tax=Aeromicrobium sp. TaxID=1871063 RepID=UPI0025C4E97B|nr:DNA polymerase III subunit delta [Aeromicrobium sp.]MCK5892483.1 DNA polymerase III subunit delta [Aeromicrobium sp.]MDF1704012.1 DNA polymerase III subunit delta [Aeromicrobium sp.]